MVPSMAHSATVVPSWELAKPVVAGALAVVGLVVAYHGVRGYRRNESARLLFLTIGILFLTTVPFAVEVLIHATDALVPSQTFLASSLLDVVGLVLILYGFTRT